MTAQHASHPPERYRLTVDDYLTLDRAGAFQGLRTELIEGEIIVMNPQYRRHGFVKAELAYRLRRALEAKESDVYVALEGSVDMSEHDMPQPDITLTREPRGEGAIPLSSIDLLIEVSDTSLKLDMKRKAPLYARHGVPEYWVVDVNERMIHRMWTPRAGEYRNWDEMRFGNRMEAATIAGLAIETDGLD